MMARSVNLVRLSLLTLCVASSVAVTELRVILVVLFLLSALLDMRPQLRSDVVQQKPLQIYFARTFRPRITIILSRNALLQYLGEC